MKNFKIGKEIKRILLSDEQVTEQLNNKCFPLVAKAGTTFPFLLYKRTSYRPASNKDYSNEIVSIEFQIVSTTYEESVNIADSVADCLNNNKETDLIENLTIDNIREDFIEDSYVQIIDVSIELKD